MLYNITLKIYVIDVEIKFFVHGRNEDAHCLRGLQNYKFSEKQVLSSLTTSSLAALQSIVKPLPEVCRKCCIKGQPAPFWRTFMCSNFVPHIFLKPRFHYSFFLSIRPPYS